jgi:hypothetical protein
MECFLLIDKRTDVPVLSCRRCHADGSAAVCSACRQRVFVRIFVRILPIP